MQTIERLKEYEIEEMDTEITVLDGKDLPSLIGGQVNELNVLNEKIKSAAEAADRAKKSAESAKKASVGFFNRKSAIEELQEAGGMLANAVQSGIDAQKTSFEFQTKLAEISKYLFGLGASNIANTRSVIRELELRLNGASEEELSDLAQQELLMVVKQLKEQEDILKKQADFSKVLKNHHLQLLDYAANFEQQTGLINELKHQLNIVGQHTSAQFDTLNHTIDEDKKVFYETILDATNAMATAEEKWNIELAKVDGALKRTASELQQQNEQFQQTMTQFEHNVQMIESNNEAFSNKTNARLSELALENTALHQTIGQLSETNSAQQTSIEAISEQIALQQQHQAKIEQELTKQIQLLSEENTRLQQALAKKTSKTFGVVSMVTAVAAAAGVVVQFLL